MVSLIRNSVWLSPLLSIFGFVSYYSLFVGVPALRDFPLVNLPILIFAVVLVIVGTIQCWKDSPLVKRLAWCFSSMASCGITFLFCWYVFVMSYQMPRPASIPSASLEAIGEESFPLANGESIQVSDFRGRKVLISFYRGYW